MERWWRGLMTGASVVAGQMMRVMADFANPYNLVLQRDTGGDGSFATSTPFATQALSPAGPNLLSATVIGPETVSQAGSFGLNVAMLFDRVVDANTAGLASHYAIPKNTILTASANFLGVLCSEFRAAGRTIRSEHAVGQRIGDQRGTVGPPSSVTLQSLLKDPGAVVSGRVLDSDGTPSAKAIVTYVNTASSPDCQDSSLVGVATLPVIVGAPTSSVTSTRTNAAVRSKCQRRTRTPDQFGREPDR